MKVLISGAGIAGPALAYWLQRAGFEPTVVELAAAPRPGGQTVDIRGVAQEVVRRMGLMPAIRARRLPEKGLAYIRANGKQAAAMPAELLDGAGPVAEIEILRGDLSELLLAATSDVEYLYGDSVTGLTQTADGVRVSFATAADRDFDLVVGADGVHSRIRALAFGPEAEFVHHLGGYGAYFTIPAPEDLDGWMKIHNAPGGRWVGLRPDHDPRFARALLSFRSPEISYNRRDVEEQKALLARRFQDVGWHARKVLDGMRTAEDFYLDSTSSVVVPEWSRGRVVLLGDAGYCGSPLAGHGTALSLVSAYVLAGELAVDGDHRRAFPAYQEVMREYVVQRSALPPGGIAMALPMSALGIRGRDLMIRTMTSRPFRGVLAKVAAAEPDAIELPDYAALTAARHTAP
ncbi:FAD-binding monooxygenase [Kribbella sp. ALI-6-A]|uniref:FAD-dependent monooxygenase n=1 Tax=Kribbella sp. ALI-6-A TaxID=1933817 RepID=UPI00097BD46B|nr:FAD-dependent monooxygenase [Kribbella sp. ALI-6-A]ONI71569.1 FAD-binding monooxygenase [Kribbella sp. ALI-6-A]